MKWDKNYISPSDKKKLEQKGDMSARCKSLIPDKAWQFPPTLKAYKQRYHNILLAYELVK